MAINADIPISTSQAISQQPVGFQEAGTYINFGQGTIAAPQTNNLTPSNSATATSAAQSPTTGTTGAAAWLPIVSVVLSGVTLLLFLTKKS